MNEMVVMNATGKSMIFVHAKKSNKRKDQTYI